MKKMLIKCFTNIVLFILFGLSFAFPFKQFEVISDYGLEVTFSIFPILLLGYIVLYLIIYSLLKTMKIIPESDTSELYYEDEREREIVAKATKNSYVTLMAGLIGMIAILSLSQIFSVVLSFNITIYQISILLITLLLVTSSITYYLTWIRQYKK